MNTLFIISSIHHLFNAAAFAVFLRHNRKNLHGSFRKMILFQNNDGKLALPCLALPCLALPCLALPCLALPCLALPCLALPCLALPCLA
ncbi:hypothetical protein [Neisseria sp. P0019.S002]|uniref:hypothetical protein n=1 Tax=Neisseria sp. P0019.S002 TaxID=3436798 RepID=UPI003F8043AA